MRELRLPAPLMSASLGPDGALWIGGDGEVFRVAGSAIERYGRGEARAERAGARHRRRSRTARCGSAPTAAASAGCAAGASRASPSTRGCRTTRSRGSWTTAGGGCGSRRTAGSRWSGEASWRRSPRAAVARWSVVVLGTERGVAEANFGSPAGFADDRRAPVVRDDRRSGVRRRGGVSLQHQAPRRPDRRRSGPTTGRCPSARRCTFPRSPARLRLGFAAFELLYPERVRFRFRVEGIDADWVDAGCRPRPWTGRRRARAPPLPGRGPQRGRHLVVGPGRGRPRRPAGLVADDDVPRGRRAGPRAGGRRGRAAARPRDRAPPRRAASRPRGAAAGRGAGGQPARAARARVARGAGGRAGGQPRPRGPPADRRHRQQRGGGQAPPRAVPASVPRTSSRSSATSSPTACARRRCVQGLRGFLRSGGPGAAAVDLSALVREMLPLVRRELQDNRVEVELDLAEGLPAVEGLRVQLGQIVVNLVMNACEALAGVEGDRRVAISTAERDGRVELAVSDNGPGLAAAVADAPLRAVRDHEAGGPGRGARHLPLDRRAPRRAPERRHAAGRRPPHDPDAACRAPVSRS